MIKFFIFTFFLFNQSVHSSFTGVECFPEKGTISVFLKMNMKDFIYDYRLTIDDDQNFDPSGVIDTSKIFVRKYLKGRIQILTNDKILKGEVTKLQSEDGDINFSILYKYDPTVKTFKVRNSILSGLFKNQSNLLIFRYKDFEESIKLTPELQEHIFAVK